MLSLQRAIELNETMVHQEHLLLHAKNVCYAMGAMARHFGENVEHWQAIGMLHDYDYEQYPEDHLAHTEEPSAQISCTAPSRRRGWIRRMCGPF